MAKEHTQYNPNQGQLDLDKAPPPPVEAAARDVLFHILSSSADAGAVSPEKDHHDLAVCHATILHTDRLGVERSLSLLIMYRRNFHLLLEVKSWAKLVKTRYGIGRAHAYRLKEHAELCIDLSGCGIRVLPTETQARKLLALEATVEVVRSIWQMASCGADDVSPKMLDRAIATFFPKKEKPKDAPKEKNQENAPGEANLSPVVFVPPAELVPVLIKLAEKQNLTVQAYLAKLIWDAAQQSGSETTPSEIKSPGTSIPAEKDRDLATSFTPPPEPEISQSPQGNVGVRVPLKQPLSLRVKAKGSRLKTSPKKPLPLTLFENLKKKISGS